RLLAHRSPPARDRVTFRRPRCNPVSLLGPGGTHYLQDGGCGIVGRQRRRWGCGSRRLDPGIFASPSAGPAEPASIEGYALIRPIRIKRYQWGSVRRRKAPNIGAVNAIIPRPGRKTRPLSIRLATRGWISLFFSFAVSASCFTVADSPPSDATACRTVRSRGVARRYR